MQEDFEVTAPPPALSIDISELNHALAVIEQFEQLATDLDTFIDSLPEEHKADGEAHLARLQSLIQVIDTNNSPIEIINSDDELVKRPAYRSIIERLGIAGDLLKERGEGKTIKELSTIYGVPTHLISRFYKYYDGLKPSQKVKLQKSSVFDTVEQLELLAVSIQRSIARLEGVNDEVAVKYTAELRQTIQLAANIAEKMANAARYHSLMETVYTILLEELPARRSEITRRIMQAGSPTTARLLNNAQ